ncbi:hypothetical protein ATANTOWER_016306 [Ataeniobius toweri]|uniref:Secreted protein n=1 Tax=Ataeniobius toweri TaxID=208326 RepID=A0ABU7BB01_9TELE|nr:hypothetical protein [Ataeniobius toweri]
MAKMGPLMAASELCSLVFFCLSYLRQSPCGLAHPQNRTGPNCNEELGLQRESSGLTFPLFRTYTGQESGKEQLKSLQTPHILHTNCLLLPSGRRYRAQSAKTSHHGGSFFPRPFLS